MLSMSDKTKLRQIEAINLILEERKRQDVKWGPQNRTAHYWNSALAEELGEVAKEVLEGNRTNYRVELVQLVALGLAVLENCLAVDAGDLPQAGAAMPVDLKSALHVLTNEGSDPDTVKMALAIVRSHLEGKPLSAVNA